MAYVSPNFKTKKALKEAIQNGKVVYVYQPGGLFPLSPDHGPAEHTIEGPHYPEPHRWYARVSVDENNQVVKVTA